MCDYCRDTSPDAFMVHAPDSCPQRACLYCQWCATYGHSGNTCSNKPNFRRLKPRQPISAVRHEPVSERVFEITTDDRTMRSFLYSQALSIAGKTEALQSRILEWAGQNGYDTVQFL